MNVSTSANPKTKFRFFNNSAILWVSIGSEKKFDEVKMNPPAKCQQQREHGDANDRNPGNNKAIDFAFTHRTKD